MKVGDWMISGIKGIEASTQVVSALRVMLRFDVNGLPVVDEDGGLVGIVTMSDIRRRVLPSSEDIAAHPDFLHEPAMMEDRFLEVARLPVEDVMTKDVATTDPTTNVLTAGALMNLKHIKQLPVVEKGKVVGLITPQDLAWGFLTKYGGKV